MIDRRNLMCGGAAAFVAAATPAIAAAKRAPFAAGGRPLGLQLYMLAADYQRDIDATLATVAAIGYREVETNFDVYPPARIKAALDRNGLRCHNVGLLPKPLMGKISLATDAPVLAEAIRTVGAGTVTCTLFPLPEGVQLRPMPGESIEKMLERVSRSMTADAWKRNADFFNAKGAELKRYGVRLCYHNHNPELAQVGETNGLAIMLEHTDPAVVDFEMDAGWVVAAGHDPVALLRAYPGRFRFMHVKDVAPANVPNTAIRAVTTEVGSGIIDGKRVLSAAIASGVRHFAVEQEPPYSMPPIDSARRSFGYLTALRF